MQRDTLNSHIQAPLRLLYFSVSQSRSTRAIQNELLEVPLEEAR